MRPGEDAVGWLCTGGVHARGYLDEKEKTQDTFVEVDGRSLVVSGDRVRVRDDRSIDLLGRDSMVINTGGEKVFAEEVEEVLRRIPGIQDAVVLGRPHPRWGNEVVAVVQPAPGVDLDDEAIRAAAALELARYKLPRTVTRTDQVRRGPNGKVDYAWARDLVAEIPAV